MVEINDLKTEFGKETALALGTFDGVHLGHRAVLRAAAAGELTPGAVTFLVPPAGVMDGRAPQLLATPEDKRRLLQEAGMQLLVNLDFQKVRDLSPQTFVALLTDKLHARRVCCGADFRFGRGRAGNTQTLRRLCSERGVEVVVCPPVTADGETVSSTRIRVLLQEGDARSAMRLLGRPFCFTFPVVHGDHRGGPILGAPTMNQVWADGLILPRFGVYAAKAKLDGSWYPAVANVGMRPTVGALRPLAETNILDFEGDLYGQTVTVALYDFLRPEQKFDGLEALKAAIHNDIRRTREVLS